MIQTRPRTDTQRMCSRHSDRTASHLRITRQPQRRQMPAQTIIRPECPECASKAPEGPERVVKVRP